MTELSEQILSSMANDIFPFSDICAKYGINSDLVFAYQAELGDDFPIGDTVARGHDLSPDMSKMPLLIQVREYDHKYCLLQNTAVTCTVKPLYVECWNPMRQLWIPC